MTRSWLSRILWVLLLVIGLHITLTGFSERLTGRSSPPKKSVTYQAPAELLPPETAPLPEAVRLFEEGSPRLLVLPKEPEVSTSQTLTRIPFNRETPPGLASAVEFWRRIYAMYDSSQVVLHDADDLSLIYAVLNFHHLEDLDLPEREKTEIRERNVSYEMERVRGRLPPAMGERLRSQTGLKDKFAKALKSSGRYLPLFEKIFESHGIPRELTRLVFVESLFEERSRSRAGASGLWQIMPATGKRYLRVSRHLDERYDPIRATHAAARILRDNYDALGSWPLAVTAYNTGAGIVRQAVRSLGRRDITTIIERYRGGNFGFASRNYFPAFLSALSICENSDHYFGPIAREPLLQFDVVTLPTSATLPQIAFLSGSSIGEVKTLNPAYSNDVLQGRYSLPPGTKLRLPVGFGQIFEARHSTLNRSTSTNKISNY